MKDEAKRKNTANTENTENRENTEMNEERTKLLQSLLERLSEGESMESVQADFVKHFESVDAEEIMLAEQSLIEEGMTVREVQKLCDVHSALFHTDSVDQRDLCGSACGGGCDDGMERYAATKGHPVQVFLAENVEIQERVDALRAAVKTEAAPSEIKAKLQASRQLSFHYAKKGDLLYPLLNRTYDYPGPSQVMWGVDDEIRQELGRLEKTFAEREQDEEAWNTYLEAVLGRIEEMIFKEKQILLPLCSKLFQEEEWMGIYHELREYETLLDEGYPVWDAAEEATARLNEDLSQEEQGYVTLGTAGKMTPEQILALLNTMPLEITFVDEDDINRFFNETPEGELKIFKRPKMALGRDVWSCHAPKFELMARAIIESFRSGKEDKVEVWMEKNGEPILVSYHAVRNSAGKYLGTMELVQNMSFVKEHLAAKDTEAEDEEAEDEEA